MKTFVVRLWSSADEVEAHAHRSRGLCGIVEPVGADAPMPFRSEEQLLGVLRQALSVEDRDGAEEDAR